MRRPAANSNQSPAALEVEPLQISAGLIREGERNRLLFRRALLEARGCTDLPAFTIRMLEINDEVCSPPLPDSEVRDIAKSALGIELRGKNRRGGEATVFKTKTMHQALADDPYLAVFVDALLLAHGARQEPFAIVAKAMAGGSYFPGWDWRRITKATKEAMRRGLIEMVIPPRGPGHPARYRFCPSSLKGY